MTNPDDEDDVTERTEEPKLSAQTQAEMEAGRAAVKRRQEQVDLLAKAAKEREAREAREAKEAKEAKAAPNHRAHAKPEKSKD